MYIYIYTYICIYIYIYIYILFYICLVSSTPNLPTNIVGFRGFDSSIILILRDGMLMSTGDFPESLSQARLVGIMLVGRLGVVLFEISHSTKPYPSVFHACASTLRPATGFVDPRKTRRGLQPHSANLSMANHKLCCNVRFRRLRFVERC